MIALILDVLTERRVAFVLFVKTTWVIFDVVATSGVVLTVPLTGTGTALSWASVKGPVTETGVGIDTGTGVALSSASVRPVELFTDTSLVEILIMGPLFYASLLAFAECNLV